MNARVDPATLFVAKPGDKDAALIALCRVALRALDHEIKLFDEFSALSDRYDREEPAYPAEGPRQSSAKLREFRDRNDDKAVRVSLGKAIAAVAAWERACAALRRSIRFDRAQRQYEQAIRDVAKYVGLIPAIEAKTLQGASFKSVTMSRWLTAGYEFEDIGRELVTSILDDVRRLGAEGAPRRRRHQAAVGAALTQ